MGVERFIAWVTGLKHLRETIPYPRMLYKDLSLSSQIGHAAQVSDPRRAGRTDPDLGHDLGGNSHSVYRGSLPSPVWLCGSHWRRWCCWP